MCLAHLRAFIQQTNTQKHIFYPSLVTKRHMVGKLLTLIVLQVNFHILPQLTFDLLTWPLTSLWHGGSQGVTTKFGPKTGMLLKSYGLIQYWRWESFPCLTLQIPAGHIVSRGNTVHWPVITMTFDPRYITGGQHGWLPSLGHTNKHLWLRHGSYQRLL